MLFLEGIIISLHSSLKMDDSWRMLIGMTNDRKNKHTLPRRRSTEDRSASLGPEDFSDVFGGPPRTVLSRQFSATSTNLGNEEFFRPPRSEGFYSDILTKSNSSSVLSSDELSNGDGSFSAFASKLRPISTPNRWSSSVMLDEEQQWQQGPEFSTNHSSNLDSLFTEINFVDNFKSFHKRVSQRCSSEEQETNNLESTLYNVSVDDQELNSPSSIFYQNSQYRAQKVEDEFIQAYGNNDVAMSFHVTEIGRKDREKTEEEEGIDEAVAWAKAKFHSEERWSNNEESQYVEKRRFSGRQMDKDGTMRFPVDKEQNELEEELLEIDMETELLDDNIIKWASDKEANIRLLLSTLHQILWSNSGWSPVPLKNLVDNAQVKKAYRKARLCLHPDKLQQRGATCMQIHVAAKVFSVLQEAWATHIS